MNSTRQIPFKILQWTAAVLGLLILLILIATWLINHSPLQARIQQAVAARTAGNLTFRHLDLSLLPRPHLTLSDAALAVPGKITGSFPSAAVYPELLPLLSGEVMIAQVRLEAPQISFVLEEESSAEPETGQTAFLETRTELESVMSDLRGIAPDFLGTIRDGRITVRESGRTISSVSAINGTVRLLEKGFAVQASAEALRWGHIKADGALLVGRNSIALKNASLSGGRSSVTGLSARFGWRVTPWLSLTSGAAVIALEDISDRRNEFDSLRSLLKDVRTLKGRITFTAMNFRGRLLHPEQWKMELAGAVDGVVFASPLAPGPFTVAHADFQATTEALTFKEARLAYRDSWITASGSLKGWTGDFSALDLSLRGDIGREAALWSLKTFSLPEPYLVRTPVALSSVKISWKRRGDLSLAGKAAFRTGTSVELDLSRGSEGIHIRRLAVEREQEAGLFSMERTGDQLDLSFRGSLNQETLDRIFEKSPLHIGWIQGEARVRFDSARPGRSRAQGTLSGGALFLELKRGQPIMIREMKLGANGPLLIVNKASVLWGDTPLEVTGRLSAGDGALRTDLDVIAGSVSLARIIDAFSSNAGEKKEDGPLPVQGTIRISANDLTAGDFVFAPTTVDVFLDRNSLRVQVLDARLCGIAISGHIQPLGRDLLIDLQPVAVEQQLEPLVDCLTTTKRITGTYTLYGKFHGKGKSGEVIRATDGFVQFSAKDGKFYTYPLLARILAFLNVTELLRGRLPDMGRDGFAYNSVKIKGTMKGGKLMLAEAVVEGATVNMAAEGVIDFTNHTLDVTVLVAPFKTIEYILSKIPVVRNLLANRLITVPVRLTGDLNNPDIMPLDPAAIGQNLLGIMRGILALPFKVLDPLLKVQD